eukprot:scaffold45520_cov64-Phaeocystis_antarctica.AAC.4
MPASRCSSSRNSMPATAGRSSSSRRSGCLVTARGCCCWTRGPRSCRTSWHCWARGSDGEARRPSRVEGARRRRLTSLAAPPGRFASTRQLERRALAALHDADGDLAAAKACEDHLVVRELPQKHAERVDVARERVLGAQQHLGCHVPCGPDGGRVRTKRNPQPCPQRRRGLAISLGDAEVAHLRVQAVIEQHAATDNAQA